MISCPYYRTEVEELVVFCMNLVQFVGKLVVKCLRLYNLY